MLLRNAKFLALFAIALAGASAAIAQESRWGSCPVIVEVFDVKTGQPIPAAKVTAENWGSDEKFTATSRSGMPYFTKLAGFDHFFSVKAPGYKTTQHLAMVHCGEGIAGKAIVSVYMWKGPSTQSVRMEDQTYDAPPYRGRYGVKAPVVEKQTVIGDSDAGTPRRNVYTVSAEPVKMVTGAGSDIVNAMPPPVESKRVTKTISGGVLNGKATSLPKPVYPAAARAVRASGAVTVQILVNESGSVISASAVGGHPLLRAPAETAARAAKFSPTLLSGQPVKVSGVVVYNMVP